jgi:hypothetical protein
MPQRETAGSYTDPQSSTHSDAQSVGHAERKESEYYSLWCGLSSVMANGDNRGEIVLRFNPISSYPF